MTRDSKTAVDASPRRRPVESTKELCCVDKESFVVGLARDGRERSTEPDNSTELYTTIYKQRTNCELASLSDRVAS